MADSPNGDVLGDPDSAARPVPLTPLLLVAGHLELRLRPDLGGAISRFDRVDGDERHPIMRGHDSPNAVLDCASFPLVPYSNRIRDGHFTFRGRTVVQAANMPSDPSPLHGQGWLAPWRVVEASRRAAEFAYTHDPGGWPWGYEASMVFELDADGLDHSLTCRNTSSEPMPCGLGLHPYFPCTDATRLDTKVTGAWTIDDKVLPVDLVAATGRYDLADRAICGQDLDNGFEGWSGEARITNPGARTLAIRSTDADRFQVYSPASRDLFVAEPIQAANAALNAPEGEWERLGLRILEPGETASLHARFELLR